MTPAAALFALAVAAAPIRLTDDVGRSLTLTAVPRRIVSTAPSNTEALFALGAGDRVVGVTSYCVDPPEARSREKVGDFSSINLEKVVALAPDLVVATWLEQRRTVERLEALGLKVLVLFPATLEETERSLLTLGRAVGAEPRARELVGDMRRRLAVVDEKVKAIASARRPLVFLEIGASPLYTAGPGSTLDELVTRAGGLNLAFDLGKPYATFSREVVIARDPDVVVVATGAPAGEGRAAFAKEPGFAALKAVRKGRVHDDLDPAILVHQNHRLVEGVERLYAILHPARQAK